MLALGYALAALVGLSLGMLGGGGSILTVPIFVYVLGFDPKLAIAMSLPVVGGASLIGAVSHWKAGSVGEGRGVPGGSATRALRCQPRRSHCTLSSTSRVSALATCS